MFIIIFSRCTKIKKKQQEGPIHHHLLELMNKVSKDDDELGALHRFL
jgi:hypothetical protein